MKKRYLIPSRSNPKWKALLNGKIDISLQNFFFQMKVTQAKQQIKNGILPIDTAIDDIVTLCKKFSKAKHMQEDLEAIFGKDLIVTTELKESNTNKKELEAQNDIADLNKKVAFFKNALEKKTIDLKEKEKLITTLQEEVILHKRKYDLLKNGLEKINDLKEDKKKGNSWSFFKLFK